MAAISTLLSTAILVLPALAIPAPAAPPVLVPWVVDSLAYFQPSGRPGSDPNVTFNVTVSDPNTIPISRAPPNTAFAPSSASCALSWPYGTKVWGKTFPCTTTASTRDTASWTVTIVEPPTIPDFSPSITHNFDLRFTETRKLKLETYTASKVFAAQGHFEYRKNLDVVCGASGVCSGSLISGKKVEVSPRRTDCDDAPIARRGDGDC